MINQKDSLNTQIQQSIADHGFTLINVDHGPNDILCFTVGLSSLYALPELIFVNEPPEMASEIVNEILSFQGIGLTLVEIVNMITVQGAPLTHKKTPSGVKQLTPQIDDYYNSTGSQGSQYELVWIGRASSDYPFISFPD